MKEQIFNLYAIVENDLIQRVALKSHFISGTDKEKEKFLENNAETDLKKSKYYNLPENYVMMDMFDEKNDDIINAIPYGAYKSYIESGNAIGIYEMAFIDNDASMAPFVNYSVVKDQKIVKSHK